MNSKRSYKYPHESLRKIPDEQVPSELDIDGDELSTSVNTV